MEPIVTVTFNPAVDRVIEVSDFAIGQHQIGRLLDRVPAGKGVNVSRVLAALGVENIATGFVGAESLAFFEASLGGRPPDGSAAVRPQFLSVAGMTRENITIVDPRSGLETHIRGAGAEARPADLERLSRKLNLLVKPDAVVVFSGSLPPGMGIGDAVALIDTAISKGARVAVDGAGPLLRALERHRLWLVKPNVAELAEAAGRAGDSLTDEEIVSIGGRFAERWETVIVSRGAAGGYLFAGGSVSLGQVRVEPKRIRSTVGCGDALLAGFISARRRNHDVRTAYRHALAVATAAALEPAPGAVDPGQVAQLLPHAEVAIVA